MCEKPGSPGNSKPFTGEVVNAEYYNSLKRENEEMGKVLIDITQAVNTFGEAFDRIAEAVNQLVKDNG